MRKKFVCLAKSARQGGLCIAGKEILANGNIGNWFRPIGNNEESLPTRDCTFCIGHVVTCEVNEHSPSATQPENYKVAELPNWQTIGNFPNQQFASLVDSPPSLWSTSYDCSSHHGLNDKVSQINALSFDRSLYFIQISSGIIKKNDESFEENQKYKMRLIFLYNNIEYSLAVTAIDLSRRYWNNLQVGESTKLGPCYLTISLAQPFNEYCYKLVAGYVAI